MNPLAAILASFGLLFPAATAPDHPHGPAAPRAPLTAQAALDQTPPGRLLPSAYLPFPLPQQTPVFEQVRIQQRVIIRVAPRSGQGLATGVRPRTTPTRYFERPIGDCLPAQSIAAVHAEGSNRLLLFLRDRRLISATLEKACSASDFYSGFYMENSEDGRLCVDRDQLHARNGAKCEVARLGQLVRVVD